MSKIIAGIISGCVFIVAMTIGLGSWYTVDQGYRGVILRNGAVIGEAAPGLGFKTPWIESVTEMSVQEQSVIFDGGKGDGTGVGLSSYSRDQQLANVKVTVNFRVPEGRVGEVYANFGTVEAMLVRVVEPRVYQSVKNVFGQFNAVTAIQERARLNAEMQAALTASVEHEPVTITGFQITNIDFSDTYNQSIEKRMQAEVEVQQLHQNAEREKVQAQITVTKAQASADSVKAAADGQAYAIKAEADADAYRKRIEGEAEASAIKARSDALNANPNIILLTQAEKWDGRLPTTMIPGSAVPFVNVTQPH